MAVRMAALSCATTSCVGRASRRTLTVACQAIPSQAVNIRREVLLAAAAVSPLLLFTQPARALLPDDDDEDLVNKAKANRAARLAADRVTTREYMQNAGLRDVKLETSLGAVQRAVIKISQSGLQLEKGDLSGAAATLSEPWVAEFEAASKKVAVGAESLDNVLTGLSSVREAAQRNDSLSSKQRFVALASDLKGWAASAGLEGQLQGL